ncbi:MAG TPA: DM13 domain-containing protein [Aeromicrobium sp.]|nr:DM13 domain-containing protein [Aeromicrobium sp.]
MRITALVGATALALSLTACGQADDEPMKHEPMKNGSSSMSDHDMGRDMGKSDDMSDMHNMGAPRSGTFAGLNGKKVAGTVKVGHGKVVLSGFSSDEGPDLYLYLAKGSDESDVMAGKSLGEVSYDEASQTFDLKGVDAAGYDTVVVHCDKAKAVFGAAELS